MKQSNGIVLALESAIGGGSISLLENGSEIGHWIGHQSSMAKAEYLLVNINNLLAINMVGLSDIDLLAVSAGPGSFTGIRIGIATALGLKAGLRIDIASESAFKAMFYASESPPQNLFTVLPVGRNAVCIQRFDSGMAVEDPRTIAEATFEKLVDEQIDSTFLAHEELFKKLPPTQNVINWGTNVARAIGLACSANRGLAAEPLFIAKSF